MSYIQQFFTSRDNNANAETFVGQEGRLWWDPTTNQIYSSDGNTPGGIPLAGGSGGATNKIYNGSSYANIASANGNVVIGADGNTWTFGTDGTLTLPGANAGETIATQIGYITVGNLVIGQGGSLFNSNNDSWGLYGNLSDSGAAIVIPSNADAGNGLALYLESQQSNVEIRSGSSTWNFDTTGNLSAPGDISAVGNVTGGNIIAIGNVVGNTAGAAIGYRDIPQVSFTGNATIATTDAGKHYYSTQSTGYTLTIANNASQSFQIGSAVTVVNQGTGNIIVAQGSGVVLYLAGNATSGNRTVSTFGMATLLKVATDTWFINGTGVS